METTTKPIDNILRQPSAEHGLTWRRLVLVAGVGFLLNRNAASTAGPWVAVGVSVLVLLGLVTWRANTNRAAPVVGDLDLQAENVAFSESELEADAGEIKVTLENKDLFWHTLHYRRARCRPLGTAARRRTEHHVRSTSGMSSSVPSRAIPMPESLVLSLSRAKR